MVAENPMAQAPGHLVVVEVSPEVFALLSDAHVTAQLLFPESDEHDSLVSLSLSRNQCGLEVLVRYGVELGEYVTQTELRPPFRGDHDGYDALCRYGMSPVDALRAVYAS